MEWGRFFRRNALGSALLMGWGAGGAVAHAFIPPSAYLLKTWVNKRAFPQGLRIKSQITAGCGELTGGTVGGSVPSGAVGVRFKAITQVFPARGASASSAAATKSSASAAGSEGGGDSGVWRSWALDASDQVLFVAERRLPVDGRAEGSGWSPLFFSSDPKALAAHWVQQGIPFKLESELLQLRTEQERRAVEQESLVRWKEGFAWVVGKANSTQPPQSPQFWFEKDTFLPQRLFLSRGTGGAESQLAGLYEVRFENYHWNREFPFPRKISGFQGDKCLFVEQVSEVILSAGDAANLTHSKKMNAFGLTEVGKATSSELQGLMQLYYEAF
jgi:hypothetical protein